jgi:hypothetical protein
VEQKSVICKVAALLLAVLTVTPTFLAAFAYATPVGRPGPESQFIEKLMEVFKEYNALMSETQAGLFIVYKPDLLIENHVAGSDLDKLKQVAQLLYSEGLLTDKELNDVIVRLVSDRKYDLGIACKTTTVEFVKDRYLLLEAKALKDDKAQLVSELIRDMYFAQTEPRAGKVVYVYPAHDKSMRDWVKDWVEKVGEKYQQVFGKKGGGALGEGALVEYASDEYLKEWMGLKANTITRLLGIAGQIALTVLFYAVMRASLVYAPPNAILASVSYNGYGSGGVLNTVVYYDLYGSYSSERVFITDIWVVLEVNGTRYTLAQFPLPVWVKSGSEWVEPGSVVVPSSAAPPPIQLPTAPGLLYDGQKLRIEVPLKQYTVRVTQPDGSVIVKTVMDTFVLEADVNRAELEIGSTKTYEVKSARVDQLTLDQRSVYAPPPPSQVTGVNPASPTPYVTVKASVAGGCGYATVVPQLWFYPSGPEVSVPNGSLVVLRAYPCDGCSLQYWQLNDGQRTWTVTGTYVGLRVNRSLTAVAYFTDPPKQPKLVLRAESSDGAPIYVNMSGWVLWYSGAVYNTTLSNALFRSLDFPLRHDIPLGFKMTANKTAVWVGVPAVAYGSYSLSLGYKNTASGCTYVTWGGYSTISGLHLLLVQAKGSNAYVYTKSGWLNVGSCSIMQGAGQTRSISGWCLYTGTYNFNNAKPEVSEQVCGWISGTYSVAKKTQLKFLRWELRGPNGVIARWYDTQAYLPAWYNSTSYRWEGTFYPLYSKPDATYELVAVYGPPQATLTAKVSAVLPDGSRVYLSSVRVNATTAGAPASAVTDGSGIAQLKLPTGNPVALAFPKVINYAPYRLVVENVTFNGARLNGLTYVNDAASMVIASFDKDGTVEIAYRAVAPLAVSWGLGGSVLPDFRQVVNGTTVYAEDGMPVTLVTKPASGYRFSRWVIVEKSWAGQPASKSGVPWNGVLWVDTKYTGAWRVDAFFDFEAYYSHVLTNVNLYVEAIDAQGRARTLASRSLWLQWSGRQKVTLSWMGVLYNEWLCIRLTSDNGVTIYLMQLNVTPTIYVFTGERAGGGGYVVNAAAMTQRRFEGSVRVSVNFTTNPMISNYQWRLRLFAVNADRKERELFATGWYTGSTKSLSLTWTGSLKDEWVKAVVESNDDSSYKSLSVYVAPQLPANATVLYRWPVQLKAEFTRG